MNGAQVSKDFKSQVAVKLAEAWLSSTYDVGQSIGQLIADGFAKPPPLGLTELLKTKRAGYFGRIDILQRIGDGDLILDCLKEIVAEKDIRELWVSAWIGALKTRAAEAVKILLDRASRESEDSLAAAVIAEVLYGLRDCETVRWSDITKNRIYPIAIRAAAHFGASTENSDEGRATITEFCRTSEYPHCWHSVSKALLSTTWWRDDLAKVLMTGVTGGRSSWPELESYLEIGPQESAAQELIAELRNLARSGALPRETQFYLLLTLASIGDGEAAFAATMLLPEASDAEVHEWLRRFPYMDDDLKATGIRSIQARPMSPNSEFEFVKDANHLVRYVAGVQTSLRGRGRFRLVSAKSTASQAVATWTFDVLDRLALTTAQRAGLIVCTVEHDYGTAWRQLATMLQSYLTRISVIAKHEWPWVIQAINVLSSRGYPIDLDILWAVFDKGDGLPTGRVLECIWAAQGVSCCDRLKRAFTGRPQKRGEILDLLERVAPLEGVSIRVDEGQLHVDGLRG